jgi:hypothetical protein
MASSEIENKLAAGHVVLRYAPGRAVAFVTIVLTWALSFGVNVLRARGILWLDALDGLAAATLAYTGFVVAVQAVRGIPLLQASEGGIAINSLSGPMFVRWRDAAEFSAGNYQSLGIRLREEARPVASIWTRIAHGSLRARRTIVVPLLLTVARPTEIADCLSTLRARYGAT